MYDVGDEIVAPPDPVRWPGYTTGFTALISGVESWPAEPGHVWVALTAVINGHPGQTRMTPVPADLPRVRRSSAPLGAPPGHRRVA